MIKKSIKFTSNIQQYSELGVSGGIFRWLPGLSGLTASESSVMDNHLI